MNDIDHQIREALKGTSEGDALAHEPNMTEELIGAFRARHRFIHGIAFVFTFAFFAIAVWAGYRCLGASVPHEQVIWGAISLLGMMSVGFLKMYFWLEIATNRVLRELKRVELLFLQERK